MTNACETMSALSFEQMSIENWIAKMETKSPVSYKLHRKHAKTRNRLFFARFAVCMKSEHETTDVVSGSNCTNDRSKDIICKTMTNA